MPQDDDQADLDDREWPDEADADPDHDGDEGPLDTVPCPYCARPVLDDADVCPHCGSFLIHDTRHPPWVRWVAALVAAAMIVAALLLLRVLL